jgi:hypothetical protein
MTRVGVVAAAVFVCYGEATAASLGTGTGRGRDLGRGK